MDWTDREAIGPYVYTDHGDLTLNTQKETRMEELKMLINFFHV